MADRHGIDRLDKVDRRIQRAIDPVAKRVNFRGLTAPGEHERPAAARFKVGGDRARELLRGRSERCAGHRGAEFAGYQQRDIADQIVLQGKMLIRIGAGQRPGRFHRIEPEKLVRRLRLPGRHEIAAKSDLLGAESDRICVERQHDARIAEAGLRDQRPA